MLHKETIEPSTLELLKALQNCDLLKDFHLAGETSLALQIGHRVSIDLDLFTQNDFDTNEVLEFLESTFKFNLVYISKNTLKGNIGEVNIDLISHKYPLVKDPIKVEGCRLLSIDDISAMKLNAIIGNGTRSKDLVDIYFILKQLSIAEILNCYSIKYNLRNQLYILKSLVYFEDLSIEDWPKMLVEKSLSITKIKKSISSHVLAYNKTLSSI